MPLRLLLVTQDASLGVTLTFDDPERELVVAGSVSQAREYELRHFDACVIDIGSTSGGARTAEMFRGLGLARALVIGDGTPVRAMDGCAYLARPFTMPELEAALERLAPLRSRRGPVRHRRLIGRLFERWTRGDVPARRDTDLTDPRYEEAQMLTAEPAARIRPLPRRSGDTLDRSAHRRGVEVRRIREVLEATSLIERLVEEQPVLADVDEVATRALRTFSDALLTSHITLWVHVPDGSHVRIPYGSGGGPGRVSDSQLFESLASSFDAVLVDRFPHPWFDGLVGEVRQEEGVSAIAGALRTGRGYHGSVVAFGHGFTEGDRDAMAELAWEVAPEIALAVALNRLGVGGRLFTVPDIEEVARR